MLYYPWLKVHVGKRHKNSYLRTCEDHSTFLKAVARIFSPSGLLEALQHHDRGLAWQEHNKAF